MKVFTYRGIEGLTNNGDGKSKSKGPTLQRSYPKEMWSKW